MTTSFTENRDYLREGREIFRLRVIRCAQERKSPYVTNDTNVCEKNTLDLFYLCNDFVSRNLGCEWNPKVLESWNTFDWNKEIDTSMNFLDWWPYIEFRKSTNIRIFNLLIHSKLLDSDLAFISFFVEIGKISSVPIPTIESLNNLKLCSTL